MSRAAEKIEATPASSVRVAFPGPEQRLKQDNEWCVVRQDGEWREIRFHDYTRVYEVPGLYEYLFHDLLKCDSPRTVCSLLDQELRADRVDPGDLTVLDLGAGNGLMGEQLSELGAQHIVGVDIIRQAAEAAERDRPGVYERYHVCDMAKLERAEQSALAALDLNCLTCIAALGFGDIPPEAFVKAYNFIAPGGWVALNLKEDFLTGGHSPFGNLIRRMRDQEALSVRAEQRYRHRLATNGEPIYYVAIVGRKTRDFEL